MNYNLFKLKLQKVVRPYTFLEERKVSLIFALMMVLMDVINPKTTWVGVY